MTKQEIIECLPSTVCRIKKSNIHGVGVHAIVDIEPNTNIFPECACDLKTFKKIKKEEVKELDQEVKRMMSDFFIETEEYYFTSVSLNQIDISYFLNHSSEPNCFWNEQDDCFYSKIKIQKGQELTLNYDNYLNSELVNQ